MPKVVAAFMVHSLEVSARDITIQLVVQKDGLLLLSVPPAPMLEELLLLLVQPQPANL